MARTNIVYKEAYNRMLNLVTDLEQGQDLQPETQLAQQIDVSRTTVRAILRQLDDSGIVSWQGRMKTVLRRPGRDDYFSAVETRSVRDKIETAFIAYLLRGEVTPGAILRETELARQFDTSSSAIREFLIRFSHFGLIEKKPNRHWVLHGFTQAFATELFDVREMFELRALRHVLAEPTPDILAELALLEEEHRVIQAEIDSRFLEFPRLDERFHALFIGTLGNRFVDDFYNLMSLIFHYHYRWNKVGERERNAVAVVEHLAVIEAILRRDRDAAEAAFVRHMTSARRTLMSSAQWA